MNLSFYALKDKDLSSKLSSLNIFKAKHHEKRIQKLLTIFVLSLSFFEFFGVICCFQSSDNICMFMSHVIHTKAILIWPFFAAVQWYNCEKYQHKRAKHKTSAES